MQIEVDDYLRLIEGQGSLLFFDIETNNLNADYGEMVVFSGKWYGDKKPFTISQRDYSERVMCTKIKEILEDQADCIVSYNGKRFDVPFINTRCLEFRKEPLPKLHHIDLYFTLKPKLRLGRKALGTIGNWLQLQEDKMSVPPKAWREKDYPKLIARCESDVLLLEQLYDRTRHLIYDIRRGA